MKVLGTPDTLEGVGVAVGLFFGACHAVVFGTLDAAPVKTDAKSLDTYTVFVGGTGDAGAVEASSSICAAAVFVGDAVRNHILVGVFVEVTVTIAAHLSIDVTLRVGVAISIGLDIVIGVSVPTWNLALPIVDVAPLPTTDDFGTIGAELAEVVGQAFVVAPRAVTTFRGCFAVWEVEYAERDTLVWSGATIAPAPLEQGIIGTDVVQVLGHVVTPDRSR